MRRTTTTLLLAAVAVGLTTVVVPSASATIVGADTIRGGCFFDTNEHAVLTGGQNVGVIGDLSVTQGPDGLPTGATVYCRIAVNGTPAPGTTFAYSGWGVQAGADQISFTATDSDLVWLEERVVYADGTDTGWQGPCACDPQIPPQDVVDALNLVFNQVNGIEVWDVDPLVCPVLAAHPGTYGPITITSDGDVYGPDPENLGLSWLYDCPPYGNV